MSKLIMIIAGEASGDLHGARLVHSLHALDPSIRFCGVGGPELQKAGVDIIVDAEQLAVIGIVEILSRLPIILRSAAKLKASLRSQDRPDLLVLIDFPEFNLHIAACAKRLKIQVLYYISPQIWAWRQGRIRKIGRLVDHMAVILPFEEKFYRRHHIPATFVGHPLMDGRPYQNQVQELNHTISIGLLPGSRHGEIARHLPALLLAGGLIQQKIPVKLLVSYATPNVRAQVEAITDRYQKMGKFKIVSGTNEVFQNASLVVAASGTVTLQTAIAGIPMVIIYKLAALSYWLGRAMIRVEHVSLVNLIARKRLVPELLQNQANPENIATQVLTMLKDDANLLQIRRELAMIGAILGRCGASAQVARIAQSMLR